MAGIGIEGHIEYQRMPGDCRPCSVCKEIIVGDMIKSFLFIGFTAIETGIVFCESCYEAFQVKKLE